MLETCWGQVDDIFVPHRVAFRSQLVNRSRHIHRIPRDHGIGKQIQASSLIGLGLFLFATERATVGEEEKLPQGMERFTFVELGMDPSAVFLAFEIAQQEDRLDEPALFLQGTGQHVLPGIRLELANEQRRRHPAQFK